MSTPIRLSKISLVFCAAAYLFFVVLNNLTDYQANYLFVSNVMSMSDTFTDDTARWRSIPYPVLHHLFYGGIIAVEAVAMTLCFGGVWRMWVQRKSPLSSFEAAKKRAIYGLTLAVVLWFLGFATIGGEWFLMWQSELWNGLPAAYRNAIFFTLLLMYTADRRN